MRRLFRKGGQSTLEYLLILTGIVAAIIIGKTFIQGKMESALSKAGDEIVEQTENLMNR